MGCFFIKYTIMMMMMMMVMVVVLVVTVEIVYDWNGIHVISKTVNESYTMTMRSKKLIASRSSSFVSTPVNSSNESVHASSYNWPNFSASLVGRLSSFKSAMSGLLDVSLVPAILLSLKWKKLEKMLLSPEIIMIINHELISWNWILTLKLINLNSIPN